jgi:hypothetical protein
MVWYVNYLSTAKIYSNSILFLDVQACMHLRVVIYRLWSMSWITLVYSLDYPLSTLWTTLRLLPLPLFVLEMPDVSPIAEWSDALVIACVTTTGVTLY